MRLSNHWKLSILLFPIIGTCVLASPGGQRGFFQAWNGVVANLLAGPSDYLHFWNPAVTAEVDQGPGGQNANSVNFTPDSVDGWNMGTVDNKYVQITGPITNGTSYTATAWVKPNVSAINSNATGGFIFNDRTGANDWHLIVGSTLTYGSSIFRGIAFYVSGFASDNNTNITDDVWQHVALVVDDVNNTIEVFVNGVSDGSSSMTGTPRDSSTGQAAIGGFSPSPTSSGDKYHGSIGKVRFYQRALTQAEIQSEYEADGETGP